MIDTPYSVKGKVAAIKQAGHGGIIRYLSPNTPNFPDKCVTTAEFQEMKANKVYFMGVFEKYGSLEEMTEADGEADGSAIVAKYNQLGIPGGMIYGAASATDFDVDTPDKMNACLDYWKPLRAELKAAGILTVGYGCGALLSKLLELGYIHYAWLAGAYGWTGTHDMLAKSTWDILQHPAKYSVAGIDADLDTAIRPPADCGMILL